ncbi:MAG: arginase [Bacilli bacterium]|nr:arginase [Bacilli bacterium]
MKDITIVGAGSDLGVSIDGARLGPKKIIDTLDNNYKKILIEQNRDYVKSLDKNDLKKNEDEVNKFNKELYTKITNENNFCITLGGDHSIAIASGLASLKKHNNLGLIWIDAHLDYNTWQTTITGNIHGLPLASLNGLNKDLSKFHDGEFFNPKNTVVVGYRAFEENAMDEINNIKMMGVTVYTTKDIKEYGVNKIMEQAFAIANKNTNGVHISFDLDVIDPNIAKGVSVKEENGINLTEAMEITTYLTKQNNIKSFDLVEYNPLNDTDSNTLKIANSILNKIIK